MDRDGRATDAGTLGSDAEGPGPGRHTRQTDPDPAPHTWYGRSGNPPLRPCPAPILTAPGSAATRVATLGSNSCRVL
jgi:hypothetical protein